MAEANINFKGSFNGTVTGPVSDEALLRAMGGGSAGAPSTPPAEPAPPPPVDEEPAFVVNNRYREAHRDDVERRRRQVRREENKGEDRSRVWPWVLAVILILILLFGGGGFGFWKLITSMPEVPMDDEGHIPVVVVQKDGDAPEEMPTIVNEINVTIHGDADDGSVKVSTPQTSRSRPRPQALPSRCVCPRDSLSSK